MPDEIWENFESSDKGILLSCIFRCGVPNGKRYSKKNTAVLTSAEIKLRRYGSKLSSFKTVVNCVN